MARLLQRLRLVRTRVSSAYFESEGKLLLSTALLYLGAIISVSISVWATEEWRHPHISHFFLVSCVIIPFALIATSFGLQIFALLFESRRREQYTAETSRFLAALDRSARGDIVHRIFLTHLLDDWVVGIDRLRAGIVTVQKEYWDVSAQLYSLVAESLVECTSSVPLAFWEEGEERRNSEFISYRKVQEEIIRKRAVKIRRTFILEDDFKTDTNLIRRFLRIAIRQLDEGFGIYYLFPSDASSSDKLIVSSDFALIDRRVFMLGHLSTTNRGVYHYDFFDLSREFENFDLFEPVRMHFEDGVRGPVSQQSTLKIGRYRKKIGEFPALSDSEFEPERRAIESIIGKAK